MCLSDPQGPLSKIIPASCIHVATNIICFSYRIAFFSNYIKKTSWNLRTYICSIHRSLDLAPFVVVMKIETLIYYLLHVLYILHVHYYYIIILFYNYSDNLINKLPSFCVGIPVQWNKKKWYLCVSTSVGLCTRTLRSREGSTLLGRGGCGGCSWHIENRDAPPPTAPITNDFLSKPPLHQRSP